MNNLKLKKQYDILARLYDNASKVRGDAYVKCDDLKSEEEEALENSSDWYKTKLEVVRVTGSCSSYKEFVLEDWEKQEGYDEDDFEAMVRSDCWWIDIENASSDFEDLVGWLKNDSVSLDEVWDSENCVSSETDQYEAMTKEELLEEIDYVEDAFDTLMSAKKCNGEVGVYTGGSDLRSMEVFKYKNKLVMSMDDDVTTMWLEDVWVRAEKEDDYYLEEQIFERIAHLEDVEDVDELREGRSGKEVIILLEDLENDDQFDYVNCSIDWEEVEKEGQVAYKYIV